MFKRGKSENLRAGVPRESFLKLHLARDVNTPEFTDTNEQANFSTKDGKILSNFGLEIYSNFNSPITEKTCVENWKFRKGDEHKLKFKYLNYKAKEINKVDPNVFSDYVKGNYFSEGDIINL